MRLLPTLPEPRHSDCYLMCRKHESTGFSCDGWCEHLDRKTPKIDKRERYTAALEPTSKEK